jgi:dienelactone hydrolase
MGPFPQVLPAEAEEELREELPDHSRILLRYRVEPRVWSEAYLLIPKGFRGRRPGMVVLHPTTNTHMRDVIGLSGRESVHTALQLVRRGYVCIAPRNYLWSEPGKPYAQVAAELLARPPWKTGMARMTWDAIRATDVLAARPEVDPERLGSIGHSLGGKEVIYHAAFDPRIRAAVSCEGGVGLSFSNWEAPWYLGPQIKEPGFPLDNHEVVALIAPRAFLLIGGESADGAQSWPYIAANLPVWRLFGKEERLGLFRHTYGHNLPPPGADREKVFGWLDRWLRR